MPAREGREPSHRQSAEDHERRRRRDGESEPDGEGRRRVEEEDRGDHRSERGHRIGPAPTLYRHGSDQRDPEGPDRRDLHPREQDVSETDRECDGDSGARGEPYDARQRSHTREDDGQMGPRDRQDVCESCCSQVQFGLRAPEPLPVPQQDASQDVAARTLQPSHAFLCREAHSGRLPGKATTESEHLSAPHLPARDGPALEVGGGQSGITGLFKPPSHLDDLPRTRSRTACLGPLDDHRMTRTDAFDQPHPDPCGSCGGARV